MALYLSASTGETQQTVSNSNDFTVHALRRDSEGMLYYTVARSTEDAVFDFHKTNGEQYTDFLEGTEYDAAIPPQNDKYQQYRFDFRRITYFIDDEGYLVARLNKTYDYTTNGPK